jgi:hypothetical protein
MRDLATLLLFCFSVAVLFTIWQKTRDKPEIPDKPLGDSPDSDDNMPDGFDSDDNGDG